MSEGGDKYFKRVFQQYKNKGEAAASPNGLSNFVLLCTIII